MIRSRLAGPAFRAKTLPGTTRGAVARVARKHPGPAGKTGELARLRTRLAEADEALRAIRSGEVDSVVVAGQQGRQVFTLDGAEHAYRVLIESMNEGALILTPDKTILYANRCFARMVKCPLEQVTGGSFRRFLSVQDRSVLRPLLQRRNPAGAKIQVSLKAGDGPPLPVQISIRPLSGTGPGPANFGLVVTDVTEARRNEELLRALNHRVVRVQEAERENVALELHDHITQLLCAVLYRSQALAEKLPAHDRATKAEAIKLRDLLGAAAREVERISRDLRPGVLAQLGFAAVLGDTCREFAGRTGVTVKLACVELVARLPGDVELALYRILQEALKNVQKHAQARHVTVQMTTRNGELQLVISDNGIGFDAKHHAARRKGIRVLGLVGMRERATYVGGILRVKSGRGAGTEIGVTIPLLRPASGG